jgi:hypothetical protein
LSGNLALFRYRRVEVSAHQRSTGEEEMAVQRLVRPSDLEGPPLDIVACVGALE